MSRAPLGILFSGHGHRLECGRCFNCNGLENMSYTGGFDPVAGFPPAGLLLAVRFKLVLNVLSVLSLLSRAREGVRLDRVSNDGYKSCRGLRIYSQALLWNSCLVREEGSSTPLSLRSLSLALSSNATTLKHLIRLLGSQGIQICNLGTH